MRIIRLLAFRGTMGRFDPGEHPLLWLGHVGIQFEESATIFGFHPTQQAILKAGHGDLENGLQHLSQREMLDGALHENTAVFERAYHIRHRLLPPSEVLTLPLSVSDETYDLVHNRAIDWHENHRLFTYKLPPFVQDEHFNCVTFLVHLGISPPDRTGFLVDFMEAMEREGAAPWHPEREA